MAKFANITPAIATECPAQGHSVGLVLNLHLFATLRRVPPFFVELQPHLLQDSDFEVDAIAGRYGN